MQCAKVFLRNLRGVAFYAVPHAGASNIAIYAKKLLKCNNKHYRGIMDTIQPWRGDMEQLSVDFDDIVGENAINVYAFCEGRPMEHVGILVHKTSARRSARDHCYIVEDADHMEVCKPPSKEHPSYALLLQLIMACRKEGRCYQPSQKFDDLSPPIFGLERYVGRLLKLVTSGGSDGGSQYVGIWGMGGVGKTLLLERVYYGPIVRGHFEGANFIWCTLGRAPDIMVSYRRLSKELGCKPERNLNRADYKRKLHFQFEQRRVCLVLDDVWEKEAFESLDFAKGKGSVTLLTTRNRSLLEIAIPHIRKVHMKILSKDDSWSLFYLHASRPPSNVPSELKNLAEAMVDECKGLPLALKVIGSAMFRKKSPADWKFQLQKLKQSRIHKGEVAEKLYDRLKLGWDCLSDADWRLQRCFIFFAAFPEDFELTFNKILWYWTGEGLVPENCADDPRIDARSLLNILLERCFIERNRSQFQKDDCTYKLHDVMRDLAIFIVASEKSPAKPRYLYRAGQNLESFPEEWIECSRALSLSLFGNKLSTLPLTMHAPKLVSLLLGHNPILSVPNNFLESLRKLKVLDLSGGSFSNLPEQLGELKHLVYLDLSACENLKMLPAAVGKLLQLKYLNLDCCENLKCLPSGIGNLTLLEMLHTFANANLRWVGHTPSRMASVDDICRLRFFTDLTIFGETDAANVPNSMSALTNLKCLYIGLINVKMLPAEMAYWFKQLEKFTLYCLRDLEELPSSFTSCGAFPALITFRICACRSFVRFPKVEKGALPKLQTLQFSICESLEDLPLSLKYLTSLTKLIFLHESDILLTNCMRKRMISAKWKELVIENITHVED